MFVLLLLLSTGAVASKVDITSYDTAIDIDFDHGTLRGRTTISWTGVPGKVTLSAGTLTVRRITSEGAAVAFQRDGDMLTLDPTPQGKPVVIEYDGAPKRGLHIDKAQAYTAFQTSEWMPCNMDPADRATLRLSITVPDAFTTVAPGALHAAQRNAGRRTDLWVLDTAASSYLYAFAAAKFHHVEEEFGGVHWHYYSVKQNETSLRHMFASLPAIARTLTNIAGTPLPVKTYRQVLVDGDIAQEGAGMALLGERYGAQLLATPQDDGLISHALAHQWWGVSVGVARWDDFWLNEGLVTYVAALDKERRYGPEAYGQAMGTALARVSKAESDRALVVTNPKTPEDASGPVAYSKGALFLHTLRTKLGNVEFLNRLAKYTTDNLNKNVTTQDFERAMAAGRTDLDFSRWAYAPGVKATAEALTFRIAADLTVTQVESGVYRFAQALGTPANALAVEMPTGALMVVDTLYTPDAAQRMLAWLDARFGKRGIVAVNTHFHLDRIGGNAAFIARKIPVWGSAQTVALVKERADAMKSNLIATLEDDASRDAVKKIVVTPPDHVFAPGGMQVFAFGKERAEVRFPGHAHAPDNTVVFFPSRQLLFAGCTVVAAGRAANFADADLNTWVLAIEAMQALHPRVVIAGHGEDTSPDQLDITVRVIEEAGDSQ